MAEHDLVIRGGTVIDGSGADACVADVAVSGQTITAVGQVTGKGHQEIDAGGAIVTPGFVDIHTHYDGQATWANRLSPSSHHGVTSVVMGNCGVGFAPVKPTDHDLLVELMEGVEDIPGAVLQEGVPWAWESFPEYLDYLDKRQFDMDIAAQLPHGALQGIRDGSAWRGSRSGQRRRRGRHAHPDRPGHSGRRARLFIVPDIESSQLQRRANAVAESRAR